jgi:hypothetical protein
MTIQLTAAVVALNLLFYFIGYSTTDLELLKDSYNISGYFYQEAFSLFWVISGLIIFVIWGAYFYRHGAAKNFYPVSRWYFHKMALLIFIPLLLFFWTPFAFRNGVMKKSKSLVSESEILKLTEIYLEAAPFLLSGNFNYSYSSRNFPGIYKSATYADITEDNSYTTFLYQGKNQKLSTILKKENAQAIYGNIYAYQLSNKDSAFVVGKDTCYTPISIFERALDSTDLNDFAFSNVKNFNYDEMLLYFNDFQGGLEQADQLQKIVAELRFSLAQRIATQSPEILGVLKKFKASLDEYKIHNTLNPEKNYNYLIKNNFDYSTEITSNYFADDYYDYYEEDIEEIEVSVDTLFDNSDNYENLDYFNQQLSSAELENLINNVNTAHYSEYFNDNEEFYVLLYFALAFTMLLLYFEWGNVLSFVISIPVGGGISILGVIINVLANQIYNNDSYPQNSWINALGPFTVLFFAGIILFIAYRGVKYSWNTHITNVAIAISYFVWPIWIAVGSVFISFITITYEFDPCLGWENPVLLFDFNSYWWMMVMKWSPFVLFFISLFAIKKILAKKE